VPPARVAEWAGHSVEVLLRVYAKCVDGDDVTALRRIEATIGLELMPAEGPVEGQSGQNFDAYSTQPPATNRILPPPAGPNGNGP